MKTAEYIKETKVELKHVAWPTRKQAALYTVLVISVSVFVALLLGVLDYVYSLGIEQLITK